MYENNKMMSIEILSLNILSLFILPIIFGKYVYI